MAVKLTKAQREVLEQMEDGKLHWCLPRHQTKGLLARGMIEGVGKSVRYWRITPAGREALKEGKP